jgi:amino acid adenylation domain-containing protein
MRQMLEQFRSLLDAIVLNPEERLSTLALASGNVRNPSVRREKLVQRQSKLSSEQQSRLAQRLGGKLHRAPNVSHIPQYPRVDKAGLVPKLTARDTGQRSAPLSFAQQRLWFMNQLEPDSPLYNITSARRVHGPLDVRALQQALDEIVVRHEILRTTFVASDGEPLQYIGKPRPVTMVVVDLTLRPHAEKTREAQQRLHEESRHLFNLATDLMLHATLLRLEQDEHFFIITMPHIISDRWSMNILFQEIAILHEAFSNGRPPPLARLPIQYADFAVWQKQWLDGETLEKELGYWKEKLAGIAVVELPTDYPRPALSREGARESAVLSKSLSEALKRLSRAEGVTLFMTLLAAFKILLQRHSGQDDISVGSPIANRNRAEIEPLIGLFLNTLVLRTDLANNPSFRELLVRLREVCLSAYSHQELPFEKLVEELHPQRDLNRHPLFDILFNFDGSAPPSVDLGALTFGQSELTEPLAKFAITLYADEREGQIYLRLVYQKALFSAERMRCVLEQFECLLEQIVLQPEKPILDYSLVTLRSCSVLPDPSLVLAEPEQELVTSLFRSWTQETPKQAAVRQGDCTWTYGELAQRAESLASVLSAQGVKKGEVVALYGSPSFGLICSLMGILLGGGVMLPMAATLPKERRQLMLKQARVKYVLYVGDVDPDDRWLEHQSDLKVVPVSGATGRCSTDKNLDLENVSLPELAPDDPAYIFFTSGTTGIPKGVLGCHKGLSHFIAWQRDTFDIGPHDRVAQLTNLSFDPVLRDIFLPLSSGATLCLPDETESWGPDETVSWLENQGISVLHTVPSLTQSWLTHGARASLRDMRYVFFAGEPLIDSLVREWRASFPDGTAEIVNLYGPTETTLAKCFYRVPVETSPGVQPVGTPLPQTQALVLGERNRLCGVGELGEIVLRTPFRSLGYINAPEEARKRFIKNPFRSDDQDLLYFTGDFGRYRPDGVLEIAGRLDDQVKIRGVRIEPEEIRSVLSLHPNVKDCVVVARKDDQNQQARLLAYVVVSDSAAVRPADLRSFLSDRLHAAMVPSSFVFLAGLPLTPNGKVDRRALPEARSEPEFERVVVAPRTPVEERLAGIWRELLKVDQLSVDDNFFDLGGHSLLASRVISQIRKALNVACPLRTVFEAPTVAQLAERIETLLWAAKQFQEPASINVPDDHVELEL